MTAVDARSGSRSPVTVSHAKNRQQAGIHGASNTTNGVPDSAKQIVQQFLDQYGLGSLVNWAWNVYTGAGGGTTGMDSITAELPNTKEFQTRFPAYQQLAKEGRAMSVQEMLSYEQTARQIFHANGIPGGFYDTPQELAKFMLNDVSASELEARVKDAQQATLTGPADVRDQLHRFYGVDPGKLTAYYLDPSKAEPLLAQQYTTAQIAADAQRTQFGQITKSQAEGLTHLGVTDAQAQSGFNKLGTEAGLFEQQVAGETQISSDQQLAAQFGGNSAAQLSFAQRQSQRLAQFQENSGFQQGQTGIGGLAPADKTA